MRADQTVSRGDILTEVDFASNVMTDLYERLAELRRTTDAPVVEVRHHRGRAWMILNYDAVEAAFQDEAGMPASAAYEQLVGELMGRVLPTLGGSEHRFQRAVGLAPLLPKRIHEKVQSILLPTAHAVIDGFKGAASIDLLHDWGLRFPFRATLRMFDLPLEDEEKVFADVHKLHSGAPWDYEGTKAAAARIYDYLQPVVAERRRNPGTDLISQFATATVDGQPMDEKAVIEFVRFLFPAGFGNTSNAIGAMMYHVLKDGVLKQRLIDSPEDRDKAVEEALRLEPPVPLITRYTVHGGVVDGVRIPPNSWMYYAIGSGNRDPDRFPEPDKFLLDRPPVEHLTFGRGPHFCLGTHLARAEMRLSLDVLLTRLKGLRLVDPDGVAFHGGILRGPVKVEVTFDEILPAPNAVATLSASQAVT